MFLLLLQSPLYFALACTVRARAACIRAISVCVLVICRVWMRSTTYFVFVLSLCNFYISFYFCFVFIFTPFVVSHRFGACTARVRAESVPVWGVPSLYVCVLVMCHACMRTHFVSVLSLIFLFYFTFVLLFSPLICLHPPLCFTLVLTVRVRAACTSAVSLCVYACNLSCMCVYYVFCFCFVF